MAKIEITVPGSRIVDEFTALVPQPSTPSGARPPDIGLVEISQSTPTQLIPGPAGPQGPRGSRWFTGNGPPASPVGFLLGDQYLDGVTGLVWTFDGTAWGVTTTDLTGPQGSPDTAAQVLAKLVTVDGAGSGLDADLLDGLSSAALLDWANFTGKPATFPPTLPIAQTGITNLVSDLALKAPLASPALTGAPTAPTAAPGDNDTSIATTAFTAAAVAAGVANRLTDAPNDANAYGRKAAAWVDVTEEAPADSLTYGRKNGAWSTIVGGAVISDTPPAGPLQAGQLWWESDTGNTYIWFVDAGGGAGQWVQQNTTVAAAAGQVGEVAYFARSTPPIGFLECNGASLTTSAYPDLFAAIGYVFGGSGANFSLPDLRGEFVRGWSNGRAGVDAARAFGSSQTELVGPHAHTGDTTSVPGTGGSSQGLTRTSAGTSPALNGEPYFHALATVENRPRNVALLPCIRYLPTVEGLADLTLTKPNFKGARVKLNADKSWANASVIAAIWDAAIEDVGGWWSAGAPTVLTVPAGVTRVRCTGQGAFASNAAGFRQLLIYKNGVPLVPAVINIYANTGNVAAAQADTGWLSVVAGDTFSLNMYQNSTAALNGLASSMWFAIEAYPGQ